MLLATMQVYLSDLAYEILPPATRVPKPCSSSDIYVKVDPLNLYVHCSGHSIKI